MKCKKTYLTEISSVGNEIEKKEFVLMYFYTGMTKSYDKIQKK